jgi:hypothetical protein
VVLALLGLSVAASLLWPEKPGGIGDAGPGDIKAGDGDGTEEIDDDKMNLR